MWRRGHEVTRKGRELEYDRTCRWEVSYCVELGRLVAGRRLAFGWHGLRAGWSPSPFSVTCHWSSSACHSVALSFLRMASYNGTSRRSALFRRTRIDPPSRDGALNSASGPPSTFRFSGRHRSKKPRVKPWLFCSLRITPSPRLIVSTAFRVKEISTACPGSTSTRSIAVAEITCVM